MHRRLLVVIALGLLANGIGSADQSGASQPPAVTFKSEVNYVEVNAVVTDAGGNLVRDLSREDFEIYENGRVRRPALFRFVELPVRTPRAAVATGALPPVEPDVRGASTSFDGRLYVLVLDDLHTEPVRSQLVQAAARRFVEEYLNEGDIAAVVHTGREPETGQSLTTSRQMVLAAIDRFRGQGLGSVALARLSEYLDQISVGAVPQTTQPDQSGVVTQRDTSPVRDPDDAERASNARRSLAALRDIARWMADIQGRRKSLLFFSEGIDYDFQDLFSNREAGGILADVQDAVGAATRSNVSIYAVNPRGLAATASDMLGVANLPPGESGRQNQLGSLAFQDSLRLAQDSLRTLADQTGGLALVNSNDFARGYERIVQDNSSYYLMGYYADPEKDRKGGTFRKIEVRVRRTGLQVRARRGYVTADTTLTRVDASPNGAPSPSLRSALVSPIPGGSLPLTVSAAPFDVDGKTASIVLTIEVDGSQLRFEEQAGRFVDTLEVSVAAVDAAGIVRETSNQRFALQLRPDTFAQVRQSRVRVFSRINLPPSRYQLRVAASEVNGGSMSVVHYDLEVPDFRGGVAISGMLLASGSAGEALTPRPEQEVLEMLAGLPHPPTTLRAFPASDMLWAFAEIYDHTAAPAGRLTVTTTVQDADGRAAFTSHDERASGGPSDPRSHHYNLELPLKAFAPGSYVLRLDVQSSLSDGPTITRAIPFQVVR